MSRPTADPPAGTTVWRRLETPSSVARLGRRIASVLRIGDLVCLYGPLGAGKSTLARGLIQSLCGPQEEAPSPTFTLVHSYETPRFALAHFDLYRLRSPEEVVELGLDEALDSGVAVVEWPERLQERLPTDRLDLELGFLAQGLEGRRVRIAGRGSWAQRTGGLDDDGEL